MTKTLCSTSTLQLETGTACNAECSFCRHKDMTRCGQMPLHQIIDVIYHLAHKASVTCPFWMQEPTIDSRLAQTLSNIRCYAPKTKIELYSNMNNYPEEAWTTILQAGLLDNLIISFSGTDKATYNKLHPPLDFEATKKNIKKLWRLRSKLGWMKPNIKIRLLVTPDTCTKVDNYFRKWKPYADDVALTFLENWNGNPDEVLEFNRKYWGEPAQRVPCSRLYSSKVVSYSGDVAMCCMDYNITECLGNVFTDGYDLWKDNNHLERLKSLHENGEWNKISACRDCTIYAYNQSKDWINYWMNKKSFVSCAINR